MGNIKVLIADDTLVARVGLGMILAPAADITVVGEAQTAPEAVALAVAMKPDVVLMDMMWFGDSGAGCAAISRIRELSPETRVVAMTVYDDLIPEARRAGADAALTKGFSGEELVGIVRAVYQVGQMAGGSRPQAGVPELSPRQREVLALLAEGMTDAEIACHLAISLGTAKNHVRSILARLGASNRADAVARALRAGLIAAGGT